MKGNRFSEEIIFQRKPQNRTAKSVRRKSRKELETEQKQAKLPSGISMQILGE